MMLRSQVLPVSAERQQQDIKLMKYLHKHGVTADEMARLCWGAVDEYKRQIHIPREMHWVIYDRKTGQINRETTESHKIIDYKGTEWDEFLHHCPIYSGFVFTSRFPLKVRDRDCGYSVKSVENFVGKVPKLSEKTTINILTMDPKFARIKVSKEAN